LIAFERRFVEAILSGKKTVTRRMWTRPLVEVGSIQAFVWKYSKEGIFANAKITQLTRGKLGDITESEARKEGFKNLEALIEYFGKSWNPDREVWIVRFRVQDKIQEKLVRKQ
jgi:hypothetical protein